MGPKQQKILNPKTNRWVLIGKSVAAIAKKPKLLGGGGFKYKGGCFFSNENTNANANAWKDSPEDAKQRQALTHQILKSRREYFGGDNQDQEVTWKIDDEYDDRGLIASKQNMVMGGSLPKKYTVKKRKSPGIPAKSRPKGYVELGRDGRLWVITRRKRNNRFYNVWAHL